MKRLFFDMDGVLAQWVQDMPFEAVCQKGYFLNLPPVNTVISAAEQLSNADNGIEAYTLSAVLDNGYALEEKVLWLSSHCPFIPKSHQLFVSCNTPKAYAVGGVTKNDYLIDDYTKNLTEWKKAGGSTIKLYNGVNGTRGNYYGDYTCGWRHPGQITKDILRIVGN